VLVTADHEAMVSMVAEIALGARDAALSGIGLSGARRVSELHAPPRVRENLMRALARE